MRIPLRIVIPLAGSFAALVPAQAADVIKANNTSPLNSGASWAGGIAPTASDIALWDSTVATANTSQFGGSMAWQGIRVSNPGGNVIAGDAGSVNTLTLGIGGADLSAATRAIQIQSRVLLSGNQTWNVADAVTGINAFGFNFSEDLSFAAQVTGALFDGGGFTVSKTGPGTAVISSGYTVDNATFNADAGTLIFSGASGRTVNLNGTVTVNVASGATLRVQGASGATNFNGTVNLNGGTLLMTSSSATNAPSINGLLHVNAASTISLANPMASAQPGPIVINGNIDGAAALTVLNTTTTVTFLRLGGDNSGYTGTATFGGTEGHATRLTTMSAGSAAATWVVNNGHTLEVDGVGVQLGTLNGNGSITNSSTGSNAAIAVGAGSFTGTVTDGALPLAVTKFGPGTLELLGANTFSGATTVESGALFLSPANFGATPVSVADAATFGVRLLTPGTTLTLPSLTVGTAAGGTVSFDLSTFGNPTASPISATAFTPTAPTRLRIAGANLSTGTFPLLNYGGGSIGGVGFAGLSLVLPPRVVGALVNNSASARLEVSVTGKDFPKWTGATNGEWDIDNGGGSGTTNWREVTSGNTTKYLQNANGSDAVLFDETATGTTTVNLTTILTPSSVTVDNSARTYRFTGTGKLSGTTGLAKAGTGTLIINNTAANDYTGTTTIAGGALQLGDGVTAGAGTVGAGPLANEATLALSRPDDFTLSNAITGAGALIKNAPSAVTFAGAVNLSGGVTINAGSLRFTVDGSLTGAISGSGGVSLAGGVLQLGGSAPNTFTGDTTISAGVLQLDKPVGTNAVGGNIVITGTGQLQLVGTEQIPDTATVTQSSDGPNTILGNETIANAVVTGPGGAGQLVANTGLVITNALTISGRIFSVASGHSATVRSISLSGGTLRIAANTNPSTLTIGAGGITASGGVIEVGQGTGPWDAVVNLEGDVTTTANLDVNRGGFTGVEKREINLGVGNRTFNIAAGTRTRVRPEVTGSGGFVKLGEGILEFLGLNSYLGDTLVNRGTLITSTAQTGTANVLVADGAALTLQIPAAGSTFTTSSLTLGATSGARLQFDLGTLGNPTAPASSVTTLTANGTTTLTLTGSTSPGTFTLINYAGAIGGAGFGSFALNLPLRVAGSLVNNTANTSVDVNILGIDTPKWNGNVNANWDVDDGSGTGSPNWKGSFSGNSLRYLQGSAGIDAVVFDDTATGPTNINLTTTLTPAGVTVNNSTLNYTFSGTGLLSGNGALIKQGSRTLTFANTGANDYTGATTVSGGTLQIGDGTTNGAGQLGSGAVTVDTAMVLNRPDDFTVSNAIGGTGTLTKNGAGTATLTGAITLSGNTTIATGALQVAGASDITGNVINNSTLMLASTTPFSGKISGTGMVLAQSGGTSQIAGTESNTYTGGTTVSAGLLQLNKLSGFDAIGGNLLIDGTGRVQLLAPDQIPNTATVTFNSNGGNMIFLAETIANLSVIGGSETSQFQAQTGLEITNLLTLSDGLFAVASNHSARAGAVNISGGILRIAANTGFSTFDVGSGGITATGGTIQVGQGTGNFDAMLNLEGNYTGSGFVEFTRGNYFGAAKRELNLGAATRTFNVTSDVTTIRPDFAGSGGLTKSGAGTLALFGTNTFTGDTTIQGGTLALSGSLSGTQNITVKSGAVLDVSGLGAGYVVEASQTLKGDGTVVGLVTTVGVLAPGEGLGTLSFTGDLALAGTAVFEINKAGFTLSADLASVTGAVGFGGLLRVNATGNSLGSGDAFNLFDATAFNGSFSSFDLPALSPGLFWETNRLPVDGTIVVIPEPASASLLLAGLLATSGFRRRKRS